MNPLHGLRIAYENWIDENRFNSLLKILYKYDTGISQIALFSSAVHAPLTLEETAIRAQIMRKRIATLKARGYFAGINVLATIGHHCEDPDHSLVGPYRTMVGKNGETTNTTYCMNDPRFLRDYVAEIYRIYAETGAQFVWIDDDIRQDHIPIGEGCFCEGCIALFNGKYGYTFTRESLAEALADDSSDPNSVALRQRWLSQNSDSICNILRTASESVRGVNPKIRLGFMTGERYAEGYRFAKFADVLSEGGKYEIMWRPGGGAYTDYAYDEIVAKSEEIGRQNAFLPTYVTTILSEVENFPYELLKKTPKSTAFEAALSMTVGCTGAFFNILPSETGEPIETIEEHMRAISDLRFFYETLQTETEGKVPVGIGTAWSVDSDATRGLFRGTGWQYANVSRELFSFGLPESFRRDRNSVTLFSGHEAAVFSDAEIKRIFAGGVYLNASAVSYLTSRGFGDLIGFSVGDSFPADAREQYTEDVLNKGITGGIRNGRQAFNPDDSFGFVPNSVKCRILTSLIDYHGNVLTPCSMGIFENELGGRICVTGYYPFSRVSDSFKTVQLKSVFQWLSHGTLPSFVSSYHRIRNVTLQGKNGYTVTLFNTSNDIEKNVKVSLLTDASRVSLTTMYGGTFQLDTENEGNAYRSLTLNLPPYEGILISF